MSYDNTLRYREAIDVLEEMIQREGQAHDPIMDVGDRDVRRAAAIGAGLRLEGIIAAKVELVSAGARHYESLRLDNAPEMG